MFKNRVEDNSVKKRSIEKSENKFADLLEENTEDKDEEADSASSGDGFSDEDEAEEDIYEEDETGEDPYEDDEETEDYDSGESEQAQTDIQDEDLPDKKSVGRNFYRGLIIAFAAGLLVIAGLLTYLWFLLKDYEACLPDNLVAEVMQEYDGADKYYYEDTVKGSGMKRFRIQDGNRRLATVLLEPYGLLSGFDHQKYRILYVESEKDHSNDIMQIVQAAELVQTDEAIGVSEDSVSADEAGAVEETPSLPISEEEENAIKTLAESYVKVYAPFSTIKDIGDLRSKVLSYIKQDTNLYERLKAYHNEWGQNVNGYDFGDTNVINIKKTGDDTYECDVESEFRTSSADWGVKRTYDLSYHMEMQDVDGNLLLTSVD